MALWSLRIWQAVDGLMRKLGKLLWFDLPPRG
jgi:hypothetical protein